MLKLIHLEAVNMLAFNRDADIGRLNAVQRGDFTVSIAGVEMDARGEFRTLRNWTVSK